MLSFTDSTPSESKNKVPGQHTIAYTSKEENNCFYKKKTATCKTGNMADMRRLSQEAPKGQQAATRVRKAITSHQGKKMLL